MRKLLTILITAPIRCYKILISPLSPPACRFHPTCSVYALEAIEKHGALKGGILTAWRIARCAPWARGGLDPVPEKWPFARKGRFRYKRADKIS